MNRYKKLIVLVVSICLVVLALIFSLKPKNNSIPITNIVITNDSEPELPFGQITRDDAIKHIEWAYRNQKPYQQFAITKNNKIYSLSYYQSKLINNGDISDNRKGLLIFEITNNKPILVWELADIPSYIHAENKIVDITGDGVKEIVSLWSNGKYEGLYIISYEIKKGTFYLLSPMSKSGILSEFTAPDSNINIDDLDGDKIPEISFPTERNIKTDPETGDSISDIVYVAYKWDGKKYFLWKESITPFSEYKFFFDEQ